jgi:glucosamine-6-phosphate deaminase
MSAIAADLVAQQIEAKPDTVLGLATGSTPEGMYAELIKKYEAGKLDFAAVRSVNLDEYYPIKPDNDQSYRYFMDHHLFNHVNIKKENVHIPSGEMKNPAIECKEYDEMVERDGGIDLQLLGIGQNGHIGFNEPGDSLYYETHLTDLTENTIQANSRFFASIDDVPKQAITMGLGTIMKAKKILLLASGKNKHEAIAHLLGDRIDPKVPATLLKVHPDVVIICDKAAYEG